MGEIEIAAGADSKLNADTVLISGLRERSPEAYAALYDRFAPGIHRFAFIRLGDVQSAEEIVVETMVWVGRDIVHFNPRKSALSSWLYGIARRRVNLEIRKRKRRKSVPESAQVSVESVLDVSDESDIAVNAAERLDARSKVTELRALLSDGEMEVLLLSCVEELSAREVGQAIGRSERAVYSILHRAKKKARERLVGDD